MADLPTRQPTAHESFTLFYLCMYVCIYIYIYIYLYHIYIFILYIYILEYLDVAAGTTIVFKGVKWILNKNQRFEIVLRK